MSIKSKVFAAAATLTLVGGAGAVGALSASAATPSCGNNCVNLFSRDFGTHHTPAFVADVLRQGAAVGQPIILFRTSNSDPAEDFAYAYQGQVSDFYDAGLVSSSLVLHYGGGCATLSTATHPCTSAVTVPNDFAFEIEYAPYGVLSGLCTGVGTTAAQGTKVALEPCGVSSKTVWVVDQADASNGQVNPALNEYVPLINGSDTNFSHPFVLTYPASGYPTDTPRVQLVTDELTGFSNPGTGDPSGVDSNQLYGVTVGTLK